MASYHILEKLGVESKLNDHQIRALRAVASALPADYQLLPGGDFYDKLASKKVRLSPDLINTSLLMLWYARIILIGRFHGREVDFEMSSRLIIGRGVKNCPHSGPFIDARDPLFFCESSFSRFITYISQSTSRAKVIEREQRIFDLVKRLTSGQMLNPKKNNPISAHQTSCEEVHCEEPAQLTKSLSCLDRFPTENSHGVSVAYASEFAVSLIRFVDQKMFTSFTERLIQTVYRVVEGVPHHERHGSLHGNEICRSKISRSKFYIVYSIKSNRIQILDIVSYDIVYEL